MIPNVTSQVRYLRLGKIRLGEKVAGQRGEYPKATDHFVFDDAAAPLRKVYDPDGKGCVMISPIHVPGNPKRGDRGWDFTSFWKTSRSAYGKTSGLFCRCEDGETASRSNKGLDKDEKPIDPQGWAALQVYEKQEGIKLEVGDRFDMPCPGEECPLFEKKVCKNLGTLDLMIPRVPGLGVWTVQTSSFNSIRNIESTLQQMADLLGGEIASIPLGLRLVPQQAVVEGKAKTIFVMELVCPHNLQQLAGLRRRALASGGSILAAIEGEVPMPDDLYPHAGADLDQQTRAETPAASPAAIAPVDPIIAVVKDARALGEALGMSKAQVEVEIRKAGREHVGALVEHWTEQLQAKGGEEARDGQEPHPVYDPPEDDGTGSAEDAEILREARGIFGGEGTRETRDAGRAAEPRRMGPPPELTQEEGEQLRRDSERVAGKTPVIREAAERKREEEKQAKANAKGGAQAPKPLVESTRKPVSPYDI